MTLMILAGLLVGPPNTPINARLMSIENDDIKVGVDPDHGGSITWLSTKDETAPEIYRDRNLVNNFDLGRQIQMSHYAGPIPFTAAGQVPADHWKHLGWNPVQSGDDFGNGSKAEVVRSSDEKSLAITAWPLQWPLDNVASEATFGTQISLDGPNVRVRSTVKVSRPDIDESAVLPRHQELPAAYFLSAFDSIFVPNASDRTKSELREVEQKPRGWTYWKPAAPWAIAVDKNGFGVGIFSPTADLFAGGVAGQGGSLDSNGGPTTYLAPIATVSLKPEDEFTYEYVITIGQRDDIAARFRGRTTQK